MSNALFEAAYAKLNLNLHITGRRADGYHLLDSLVVFIDLADQLEGEVDDDLTLQLSGPFAAGLSSTDNLVMRAAEILRKHGGGRRGARLKLHKAIPHGAGLGGGSADAAATLRLLNQLWDLDLPDAKLKEMAVDLGADVPACIASQPVRMRGIGDELTSLPSWQPAPHYLLVYPGRAVSTVGVYQALKPPYAGPLMMLPNDYSWPEALRGTRNDLQKPAITLCDEIQAVLQELQQLTDATRVGMTGSGSACYALFAQKEAAKQAHAHFAAANDDYFTHSGQLR